MPANAANELSLDGKSILDMCCGPRMFWFDKQDERAVFMDKWNETQIPVSQIIALSDEKPAVWQRTGKNDKTHWIIFVKSGDSAREVERG